MTILYVIIALVVIIGGWLAATYNKLIQLRNTVKDQLAQIETVLKRRFDLIPNLVETVKGYTKHEKSTLEDIVNARNSYSSAKTTDEGLKADGELVQGLSKLFALAEAYPDLKANENYISLQNELTETEDKIQYARQFYNDTVLKYNNAIQVFPAVLIAGMLGFKEEKFFEAKEEEKENVEVKF